MSHPAPDEIKGLPENARRPLRDGEVYIPLVPGEGIAEVTPRSVLLGALFCAVFSMAAAYLALKVGLLVENLVENLAHLHQLVANLIQTVRLGFLVKKKRFQKQKSL